MKTDTAPQDYNRRVVIKSQKIKLCDECCGYMTFSDKLRCASCRNTSYVIVYEHEAADFRREVAAAHDELKEWFSWELAAAIYFIDETEEEVDALLALTTRPEYDPFYLDKEPTVNELREIEHEQAFIGKWFTPAPSDIVSLEINSMLMQADLGTHTIASGSEMLELDAPQAPADKSPRWCSVENKEAQPLPRDEWQDEEDDDGRAIFLSEYGDR